MEDISFFFEKALTICIVVIASLFGYLIAIVAVKRFARLLSFGLGDDPRIHGMIAIFLAGARLLFFAIIILGVLSVLDVNIAPLLAGAGVAGIIVSFALQAILKDVAAGIHILVSNKFRQGDIIMINGIQGVVEHISLTKTIVRDKQMLYHIPNGTIAIIGIVQTAHHGAVVSSRRTR